MINKENEYNKGIYDLLKVDFEQTTDDNVILDLIKDLFLTDLDDISNEDVVKKLLKDNISNEDAVKNLKPTDFKETTKDEVSLDSLKKLLFSEEDYIDNEDDVKKLLKDE